MSLSRKLGVNEVEEILVRRKDITKTGFRKTEIIDWRCISALMIVSGREARNRMFHMQGVREMRLSE